MAQGWNQSLVSQSTDDL